MGRNTNSRLSRRHDVYKPTRIIGLVQTDIGKQNGLGPVGLDSSKTDPECAPKVPRRIVRPCAQRQMKGRNGVKAQRLSLKQRVGVNRMQLSCGIVSEAKALGKAERYADRDTMSGTIEAPVGVKTL